MYVPFDLNIAEPKNPSRYTRDWSRFWPKYNLVSNFGWHCCQRYALARSRMAVCAISNTINMAILRLCPLKLMLSIRTTHRYIRQMNKELLKIRRKMILIKSAPICIKKICKELFSSKNTRITFLHPFFFFYSLYGYVAYAVTSHLTDTRIKNDGIAKSVIHEVTREVSI